MSNWKFIILFLALIGVFVSFGQDLPKKALKRINPYWDLKSNPAKDIKITQFKVEEINLAERTLTIPDFTVYVPEKAEIVQVKTFNVREESEDERIEGEPATFEVIRVGYSVRSFTIEKKGKVIAKRIEFSRESNLDTGDK